jgi:D-aminopeptidase
MRFRARAGAPATARRCLRKRARFEPPNFSTVAKWYAVGHYSNASPSRRRARSAVRQTVQIALQVTRPVAASSHGLWRDEHSGRGSA